MRSFVLSVSRITHERGNGRQRSMARVDRLEVVKCWCWSGYGCATSSSLALILGDTNF